MNNHPPTPSKFKTTVIQLPRENEVILQAENHLKNPKHRSLTLTINIPVLLEICIDPEEIRHLSPKKNLI